MTRTLEEWADLMAVAIVVHGVGDHSDIEIVDAAKKGFEGAGFSGKADKNFGPRLRSLPAVRGLHVSPDREGSYK